MNEEDYGSVSTLDHCYPLSKTFLFNENELSKSTHWINLRPMYSSESSSKRSKIDHRLYLKQKVKAN